MSNFFKKFLYGIENLSWYFKVIWQDRWYDYNFIYILLDRKLEQMKNKWETSTIYEDSDKELYTIQEMRKLLRLLIKDNWISDDEYDSLYKSEPNEILKLSKLEETRKKETKRKFFLLLYINIDKLWD